MFCKNVLSLPPRFAIHGNRRPSYREQLDVLFIYHAAGPLPMGGDAGRGAGPAGSRHRDRELGPRE